MIGIGISRIDLIKEISDNFPDKAAYIFSEAEKICAKNPHFNEFSETKKVDLIIETIINDQSLLSDENYLLMRIKQYLKKIRQEHLENYTDKSAEIVKHPFFSPPSLTTVKMDFTKEELTVLADLILTNLSRFDDVYHELTMQINKHLDFISRLSESEKIKETKQLKEELEKSLVNTFSNEQKILEIYKSDCQNLKAVEEKLLLLNEAEEIENFRKSLKAKEKEMSRIIHEQGEVIAKINKFQFVTMDHVVEFSAFVNKFTTYLLNYPLLKNLIIAADKNNLKEESKNFKNFETNILHSFTAFMENIKLIFSKNQVNSADKKAAFRQKFLEPLKDKIPSKIFKTMIRLIDMLL